VQSAIVFLRVIVVLVFFALAAVSEVDRDVDGIRHRTAGDAVRSEAKHQQVRVFLAQPLAEAAPQFVAKLVFAELLLDAVPYCLVGLVDRIEVARLGAKREDGSRLRVEEVWPQNLRACNRAIKVKGIVDVVFETVHGMSS